jgi:hypothetical protein
MSTTLAAITLLCAPLAYGFTVQPRAAFHTESALKSATMTRFDRLKKNYKGPKLDIGT